MTRKKFIKQLDTILVPVLAIISGLVVMGVLILLIKKPLLESYFHPLFHRFWLPKVWQLYLHHCP